MEKKNLKIVEKKVELTAFQEAVALCKELGINPEILGDLESQTPAQLMEGFLYHALGKLILVRSTLHLINSENNHLDGYRLSGTTTAVEEIWTTLQAAEQLYSRTT